MQGQRAGHVSENTPRERIDPLPSLRYISIGYAKKWYVTTVFLRNKGYIKKFPGPGIRGTFIARTMSTY